MGPIERADFYNKAIAAFADAVSMRNPATV